MKLLVTGGAGFIGSNFCRYLLKKYPDYFVLVYDKLTYAGNPDNLKDLAEDFAGRYAFVQADICDAQAVEQAIKQHQIELVPCKRLHSRFTTQSLLGIVAIKGNQVKQ